MKKLLAATLLFAGSNIHGAERPAEISDLKVSFWHATSSDYTIAISGTATGLSSCQLPFYTLTLETTSTDDNFNIVSAHFVSKAGISNSICVDEQAVSIPFSQNIEVSPEALGATFIASSAGILVDRSLAAMLEYASCAVPESSTFGGGLLGPGPVLFETCTYKVDGQKPNPFVSPIGLPMGPGPVIPGGKDSPF